MEISPIRPAQMLDPALMAAGHEAKAQGLQNEAGGSNELRKAFDSFVGESFYGQLLSAMRKSTGRPAYFHGGQAEEVFRGQLDQTLAAKMAENNAGDLTGGMFELFNLNRQ